VDLKPVESSHFPPVTPKLFSESGTKCHERTPMQETLRFLESWPIRLAKKREKAVLTTTFHNLLTTWVEPITVLLRT
jgi:hypothetical protein